MTMVETSAERWMSDAVRLSRRGYPAPNPQVGCVVVAQGVVVGKGWHGFAGGAHAEVVALAEAGPRARGADLYVTLEPCMHHGRTAPCTRAILDAGVRRVFYAVADPNPKASGGARVLRESGVEVYEGVLREVAEASNWPFLVAHRRKRPWVVLKAAISMDGYLARPDGASRWITGPQARREGYRLRARLGAVLVGRRTVEVDDPLLTARVPGVVHQPLRVVLDPSGLLDPGKRVFGPEAETWQFVREPARPKQMPLREGVSPAQSVLQTLFDHGYTGLLVEGGAFTHRSFLEEGLTDAVELFVAPVLLGEGIPWHLPFPGLPPRGDLREGSEWALRSVKRRGSDVQLSFYRTTDPIGTSLP